jgi:hypothetical protein
MSSCTARELRPWGRAAQRPRAPRRIPADAALPIQDWTVLYVQLLRLEQALSRRPTAADDAMVDDGARAELGAAQVASRRARPQADVPASTLLRDALADLRRLARDDIAIAKREARMELDRLRLAAILFAVAAVCGWLALAMGLCAGVMAIGGGPVPALAIGSGLALLAVVAGATARGKVPRVPLERTRRRIADDAGTLGRVLELERTDHDAPATFLVPLRASRPSRARRSTFG